MVMEKCNLCFLEDCLNYKLRSTLNNIIITAVKDFVRHSMMAETGRRSCQKLRNAVCHTAIVLFSLWSGYHFMLIQNSFMSSGVEGEGSWERNRKQSVLHKPSLSTTKHRKLVGFCKSEARPGFDAHNAILLRKKSPASTFSTASCSMRC